MSDNEIKVEDGGKNQKRSRLYPRYGLEQAVNLAKSVDALGGARVAKAALASHIGSPANSSSFLGRVSSAKQFGLIEAEGGYFACTPRANRILHEVSPEDKRAALCTAFAEPNLYAALCGRFNGKNVPPRESVGNILLNDSVFGVEKNASKAAASIFLDSAAYAGVLKNGILVVPEKISQAVSETDQRPASPLERPVHSLQLPLGSKSHIDNAVFDFTFDGGIRLIVPQNATTASAIADGELKTVRQGLKDFAEKFLREAQE